MNPRHSYLLSILHSYHHLFTELVHLYNLPLYWVCWGHKRLFVIWLQGCLRETIFILRLPLEGNLLLSQKPLHLEAQQRLQEEGCVVDIRHPQTLAFRCPQIILGCHGNSQAQALATPCSIIHQIFYPKLENFSTQNLTENLVSSVSERKQNTTSRYCNELILYLYWCYTYCIPTSLWFINYFTSHRFIKISKQHAKNRICQKQNSLQ